MGWGVDVRGVCHMIHLTPPRPTLTVTSKIISSYFARIREGLNELRDPNNKMSVKESVDDGW